MALVGADHNHLPIGIQIESENDGLPDVLNLGFGFGTVPGAEVVAFRLEEVARGRQVTANGFVRGGKAMIATLRWRMIAVPGRLIRHETDRGLLVVCDPRMAGMNYGRRLRQALPPMTEVKTEAEALAWLASLAEDTVRA